MSLPAVGWGTDGVIAMSSGAQGPEGIATGETSSVACFFDACFPAFWVGRPASAVSGDVGPVADDAVTGDPVSATVVARSGPEDPSLEPPSSRAMPTVSSRAMPRTISRRTQ